MHIQVPLCSGQTLDGMSKPVDKVDMHALHAEALINLHAVKRAENLPMRKPQTKSMHLMQGLTVHI